MATYLWPGDTGWPISEPDRRRDEPDLSGEIDIDALSLRAAAPHLWDGVTPLERTVLAARFGLDHTPMRSMKQLHADLGLTRHEVREQLESGLAKLRAHLS